MMEISGGRIPGGRWATHDDATVPVFIGPERDYPKPDGKTTFDKLSSVFATGNATRDDAPNHIRIQEKVPLEVALMWQNMCPAQVYEVPDEELEAGNDEVKLQITPSNCVQCGAITAKGGRLTPPEGGDGPNYQQT
jgi:electron-transferring-flavoprotein dehydrogenase